MKSRFRDRIHRFFQANHVDNALQAVENLEDVVNPTPTNPSINDWLPNELLANIFLFNVERTLSAFSDIMSITHTCSRWRAVALECPELWTNYPFVHTISAEACQTLLGRCGDLMLNVGWDRVANLDLTSSHRNYELLDLEADNAHRFRTHSILLSPHLLLTRIRPKPPSKPAFPTPLLEELVVDTGDLFQYHRLLWKITEDNSPSLRILRLRATWFDLSDIRTHCLHTLDVALPSHGRPWRAQQWIVFLQGCQNLAHLCLNLYSLLDIGDAPSAGSKRLSKEFALPTLSHLVLSTPLSFSSALLNRFNLPSIRVLGITWPDRDIDGDIHRVVSNIMVPLVQSLSAKNNRMQICTSDANGKIYVGFTPENYLLELPPPNWGQYAVEHFGSGEVGGRVPNDYFQLRMKRGAWRLSQLLPYWGQVARLVSALHVDTSRDDPISSAPIREFLLNFARKDIYTIWDYKF